MIKEMHMNSITLKPDKEGVPILTVTAKIDIQEDEMSQVYDIMSSGNTLLKIEFVTKQLKLVKSFADSAKA